jgi:uncharacterized protein YbjT (DUF2867 family)
MSTTEQRIAIAGATGRVGHHAVEVLTERGHTVIPMSRATGVDVITGEGLAKALTGVDTIIDVATGPSPEQQAATEFFTTAANKLQNTGQAAGVQRIIVVSIVATDKFTGGYGAAKVAHERATLEGPVPALVLRATQFHEFVELLMQWGRQDGVSRVQNTRMQPIAARSVAEELADLATTTDPASTDQKILDIAGPREESLVELARMFAAKHEDPVQVEGWSNPDDPDAHLYESGAILPGPGAKLAGPTFEEWLKTN